MNEYSRELMHMTTAEKADYNRRYYQRNKQYWKDYYKTGHGIGRKPGALSGVDQNYRDKAVGNDPGATSIKFRGTTPDGRPMYQYHKSNASYYRSKHKSLDDITKDSLREKQEHINALEEEQRKKKPQAEEMREAHKSFSRWANDPRYDDDTRNQMVIDSILADSEAERLDYEARQAGKRANMARGDMRRSIALRDNANYRNNSGPRTANIEKTVGVKLKSALTRSVRSIKSNANKAMKFIESLFK